MDLMGGRGLIVGWSPGHLFVFVFVFFISVILVQGAVQCWLHSSNARFFFPVMTWYGWRAWIVPELVGQ